MGQDFSDKVLYCKSKWFYWACELRRLEGLKTSNITHWLDELNVITSGVCKYTLSNWLPTNQARKLQDGARARICLWSPSCCLDLLSCIVFPFKRDEASPKDSSGQKESQQDRPSVFVNLSTMQNLPVIRTHFSETVISWGLNVRNISLMSSEP